MSKYNVPKFSGKVSGQTLSEIETVDLPKNVEHWEINRNHKTLYTKSTEYFQYDMLFVPKAGASRLFVLFSGDAMRSKNNPPVFQRWSWSEYFPGHVLYISDPTLHLDDNIGLAWYSGIEASDPLKELSIYVLAFANQMGVSSENIVTYGSSGGGFAALRMHLFMENITSVSINPQTDIGVYKQGSVEKYYSKFFSGRGRSEMMNDFSERVSLVSCAEKFRDKKIVIAQNDLDEHHYEDHFKPFFEALTDQQFSSSVSSQVNFKAIIFSHEGGHKKAETPAVFEEIMQSLDAL